MKSVLGLKTLVLVWVAFVVIAVSLNASAVTTHFWEPIKAGGEILMSGDGKSSIHMSEWSKINGSNYNVRGFSVVASNSKFDNLIDGDTCEVGVLSRGKWFYATGVMSKVDGEPNMMMVLDSDDPGLAISTKRAAILIGIVATSEGRFVVSVTCGSKSVYTGIFLTDGAYSRSAAN